MQTSPQTTRVPVLKIVLVTLLVSLPLAGVAGSLGGYFFGRRVVVSQDGTESPLKQTIQVEESSAIVDAVEKVSPAVVSVLGEGEVQGFFGSQPVQGAGSGFIITADGLIATNKHVVENPSLKYTVVLSDGTSYPATVVSHDPSFDFAIVKIDARDLPVVELGSSDSLKVGESVIAIGNAFGEFQNTVTVGVVSARNRSIAASDGSLGVIQLEGLIQTDAAINPGNSGGPLVNLAGQVVGVNTATDVGSENIGFAIPIDEARVAIESVIDTGTITRPMLGVRYVNLTKEIAELNDLTVTDGAYVTAEDGTRPVIADSPADQLGIKEDDIILKINDDEIRADHSLAAILRTHRPGDEVTVTWLSGDQEKSQKVKLEAFEEEKKLKLPR
jgi:serine protease Do